MRSVGLHLSVLALATTLAACASGSQPAAQQAADKSAGADAAEASCLSYAQPNISGVNAPKRLQGEQPSAAELAQKTGYACVRVTISPSGAVIDPQVVRTDNDEFARAFVRALGDWRYEPATRGTAKVPYHTVLFARLPG